MKHETSLKDRIYRYLVEWHNCQPDKFINGGEIERLALEIGYKASNASRRCRELCDEGKIQKRFNNGTVEYRYEQ